MPGGLGTMNFRVRCGNVAGDVAWAKPEIGASKAPARIAKATAILVGEVGMIRRPRYDLSDQT